MPARTSRPADDWSEQEDVPEEEDRSEQEDWAAEEDWSTQDNLPEHERRSERDDWEQDEREEQEGDGGYLHSGDGTAPSQEPDVLLDVPTLHVDEINLEVENLRARVSLQAEVLDLLKLNVGADVVLGRVHLDIKGVDAEALLKVRLNNVARILDRVMTTIDENPEILQNLTQGLGSAAERIGGGAGEAIEDVGGGAGRAVESVGHGAGTAVEDVGRGAGGAVEDVGTGAGDAAADVGRGAGGAVRDVGSGTGETAEGITGAGQSSRRKPKRAPRTDQTTYGRSERPSRRRQRPSPSQNESRNGPE